MKNTEGKLNYAHRQRRDGMYATELFDEKGETVATAAWYPVPVRDGVTTNRAENARRLVACWNLLLPFKTEDIEVGIDLVELVKKRDELANAAEALRDFVKRDVRWPNELARLLAELDAALDKVK